VCVLVCVGGIEGITREAERGCVVKGLPALFYFTVLIAPKRARTHAFGSSGASPPYARLVPSTPGPPLSSSRFRRRASPRAIDSSLSAMLRVFEGPARPSYRGVSNRSAPARVRPDRPHRPNTCFCYRAPHAPSALVRRERPPLRIVLVTKLVWTFRREQASVIAAIPPRPAWPRPRKRPPRTAVPVAGPEHRPIASAGSGRKWNVTQVLPSAPSSPRHWHIDNVTDNPPRAARDPSP